MKKALIVRDQRNASIRAILDSDKETLMEKNFIAHASVNIAASRDKVWDALVNPETIKKYMSRRAASVNPVEALRAE